MIKIKNVTKRYNENNTAVKNISLNINEGEIVVLLGKSGCGKTTTLKMINRLIEYDSGKIYIKNKEINDLDPIILRRSIGYVIQSIGLFPHMTIEKNISVVPGLLNWDTEKIRKELLKVLNIIRLPDSILKRYPHELSGGQKQRIGVARAIIANPKIILMDEPFGALDPITREELQEEFLNLQNVIQKTIVFVTHDIFEAFTLANKIAIMDNGIIVQTGTPYEILKKPENDFVDRFIGKYKESLLSEIKT
ncbi:MAG: ATP-binding cassette domain-containing protein [Spirochaetes bacterium]|nr:ATP-binding cassette domain-containing protein [Spirochaetota bacterium]